MTQGFGQESGTKTPESVVLSAHKMPQVYSCYNPTRSQARKTQFPQEKKNRFIVVTTSQAPLSSIWWSCGRQKRSTRSLETDKKTARRNLGFDSASKFKLPWYSPGFHHCELSSLALCVCKKSKIGFSQSSASRKSKVFGVQHWSWNHVESYWLLGFWNSWLICPTFVQGATPPLVLQVARPARKASSADMWIVSQESSVFIKLPHGSWWEASCRISTKNCGHSSPCARSRILILCGFCLSSGRL